MDYLHFTKEQLNDLDFSLEREYLLVNQTGTYCSSSIINCNTRKSHGLLVTLQPQIDNERYVLLSSLDETIVDGTNRLSLATKCFSGVYEPKGYCNMEMFTQGKSPAWLIKINGFTIKKELLLVQDESRILIRYQILEAPNPAELLFTPFLAFRSIYNVSQANMNVTKKTGKLTNGIKIKLYSRFDNLCMQFSHNAEFIEQLPHWYYNNEYSQEKERGYEYNEALYCPGYFKLQIKKGDTILFSAGLSAISAKMMAGLFSREEQKIPTLRNFNDCLENAASHFIVISKRGVEINAGYHWYRRWGRDTFISLPGLTLATGRLKLFKDIVKTMETQLKGGLFPNMGSGTNTHFNTADASLWYFWALQQYSFYVKNPALVWKEHGLKMRSILENYVRGTLHHIHMKDNGLIYAGEKGIYVTWMDAIIDGRPVTPRTGMPVELSALWYNAVCFALEAANKAGDKKFVKKWERLPEQIKDSFNSMFWNDDKGYLADCICEDNYDWSLRPNQIFAVSLPYTPLDYKKQKSIVDIIKKKLLTPRGLRSLSPDDKNYKGIYSGNQTTRDKAYHQGTVWPWLIGHFAEAYLRVYGEKAKEFLENVYENFVPAVIEGGIGTISEIYDGDSPQIPRGAISQAWSVAELLRMRKLIAEYSPKKKILIEHEA